MCLFPRVFPMAVDGHPINPGSTWLLPPLHSCRVAAVEMERLHGPARLHGSGAKNESFWPWDSNHPDPMDSIGFYWILRIYPLSSLEQKMELSQQLLKPQSQGPGVNPSEPWKLLLGRKAELLLYYIIVIYSDSIIAYFCPKKLEK